MQLQVLEQWDWDLINMVTKGQHLLFSSISSKTSGHEDSCVPCSPLKLQHHGGVLKESEVGKLQFVVLHHLDKITRPSLKQTRGRGGVNLTIELSLAYRDVSSFSKSPDKVVFSSNRWYFKELLTNFTPRKTASLYDMSTFIIWLIHPNYLLVFILICSKTFWFFLSVAPVLRPAAASSLRWAH